MNVEASSSPRPVSENLDVLIGRIGVDPLDEILRDLLRRSANALGVERVGYWSMNAAGTDIRREMQFLLSRGAFDAEPLRLTAEDFPKYFEALHHGSSLIVSSDAMADPRLAEFRGIYFTPLGIGAMLDAPVHRQGRLFGVVCHEHIGGTREWSGGEIDFVRYVTQWIALAVEIDERLRMETALRESEERYRLVIDHSPTPTVVVDMETGCFTDANESALHFYGVDREALMGGGPADFSPEFQPDGSQSMAAARGNIARALAGERPCFDWVHRGGDGREIPCSVHLARVPGTGRQARVIATVTDRTEQLRNEETIRRALEQERENNELRSRFTSIVSHEFRTPLGIIMSAVELLENYLDRLDSAKRKELFDDIRKSTKRMVALMEQVLVLGRSDEGKMGFSPMPLDLRELCGRLADESLSTTVRRCPILLEIEGDVAGARADEPLLRHIFSNLLSNAVKYSPPGRPVTFRVRRQDQEAVFEIEDLGIGIPEGDQANLFAAFQRAGNVGETPGTGLGLLIVKRCVELHQGSVDFTSELGRGTAFVVRLPGVFSEPV